MNLNSSLLSTVGIGVAIAFTFSAASAHSQITQIEPTPAELAALTKSYNEAYNGSFITEVDDASIRAAKLSDDKLLVETAGELAKFMLYNLNASDQTLVYVPRVAPASWRNEFIRRTPSAMCGLVSYDLKADPLPKFKCRFTIDSLGKIEAYGDRPTKPADAPALNDFFFHNIATSASTAYSFNWVKVQSPVNNFELTFSGRVANSTFSHLKVRATEKTVGSSTRQLKNGDGLWCFRNKCTISFLSDGTAKSDSIQ
ncbi:MAG: hypothetical protein EOP05_10450 [Proteobacteria bacterium]|nr:MAG: hypothetical protein EOP05_10450 [Pseudomonadota bacterium]